MRLDRWFRVHFPEITYGHLQKLLRSGQVRLDSKRAQANARVESGQQVRVPAVLRCRPKDEAIAHAAARSFQGATAISSRR
jgi:23S rRNA pseudouridine955/2504/2580 synthase